MHAACIAPLTRHFPCRVCHTERLTFFKTPSKPFSGKLIVSRVTDIMVISFEGASSFKPNLTATVAERYRYRIVAFFVTSSIPVPLRTRGVGQRCTLNLSRAETSSRWCGVVIRRGGASSGVVHVT
ncbi:uncharacterized protein TNCV_939631 [Trichonephila clavipes]|nr:uncharacterized protein TNCV_939631 [Trichonephila clavipes]